MSPLGRARTTEYASASVALRWPAPISAGDPFVAGGVASAVMTRRTDAIANIAVLGALARLTARCRFHALPIAPTASLFPTTATKSGTASPGRGPRDRDRRLRRLPLSTSLPLGHVHAATTRTGDAAPHLAASRAPRRALHQSSCLGETQALE